MTHHVPEHLIRPAWNAAETAVSMTCTPDGCTWYCEAGYRGLPPGATLTLEQQRNLYRSALQAASVHGWPDLDHLPVDGILSRAGGCACPPDPTASPSFWARIRGAGA